MEDIVLEQAESEVLEANSFKNDASASIGKFKDATALLKAYVNLEAKFTKKCQQLSYANELLQKYDIQTADNVMTPAVPLYKTENWQEAVDGFITEFPKAKNFIGKIMEIICENEELAKGEHCLNDAYLIVLNEKFRLPEEFLSDEDFINSYILNDEKINRKILYNVLKSKSENSSPNLLAGNGSYILSPVNKPKTLKEAGEMAKRMLK